MGAYRMLAGKDYQPKYLEGVYVFTEDPPDAVSPLFYNCAEYPYDTRVAYGNGMSEWCGNCHFLGLIHSGSFHGHPTGDLSKLTPTVIRHYNSYVASGNLTGSFMTAYTSMVPFEMGTNDYAVLKNTANSDGRDITGPDRARGSPNVMCLSCHRAHASGWDNMTLWNMKSEFLVYNGLYPGIDTGAPEELAQGRTSREVQSTFYGRPPTLYASYQRSLCNKCHVKD